jgi:hypothetical protein
MPVNHPEETTQEGTIIIIITAINTFRHESKHLDQLNTHCFLSVKKDSSIHEAKQYTFSLPSSLKDRTKK